MVRLGIDDNASRFERRHAENRLAVVRAENNDATGGVSQELDAREAKFKMNLSTISQFIGFGSIGFNADLAKRFESWLPDYMAGTIEH